MPSAPSLVTTQSAAGLSRAQWATFQCCHNPAPGGTGVERTVVIRGIRDIVLGLDLVKKVLPRQEWKEAGVRGIPGIPLTPAFGPLLPRKDLLPDY